MSDQFPCDPGARLSKIISAVSEGKDEGAKPSSPPTLPAESTRPTRRTLGFFFALICLAIAITGVWVFHENFEITRRNATVDPSQPPKQSSHEDTRITQAQKANLKKGDQRPKREPPKPELIGPDELKKQFDAELRQLQQDLKAAEKSGQAAKVIRDVFGSLDADRKRLESLLAVEGCYIIAADDKYLGKISSNEFDLDSIMNSFGDYGSKFSNKSIFNDFGDYGGMFAMNSPFNKFATDPPRVYTSRGAFVAYLTVNTVKAPVMDPHFLIAILKQR